MSDVRLVSVSDHPRAGLAVRRAKARAGLFGFAFVALLGFLHGAPMEATVSRALLGGLVAYVFVWGAAMAVWKRILVAEAVAAARRIRERNDAAAVLSTD